MIEKMDAAFVSTQPIVSPHFQHVQGAAALAAAAPGTGAAVQKHAAPSPDRRHLHHGGNDPAPNQGLPFKIFDVGDAKPVMAKGAAAEQAVPERSGVGNMPSSHGQQVPTKAHAGEMPLPYAMNTPGKSGRGQL